MIVKICGLSERYSMQAALDAGADMVGLVSFAKSPRHVDLDAMAILADQARGQADIVVLTVNADDEHLNAIHKAAKPDWWQFHGSESEARIEAVRARFGRPIMKAVGVGSRRDVATANHFGKVADRLLLDAKPPKDATRPGGLGAVFDWALLADLDESLLDPHHPFMLSGGLDPKTVGAAILATGTQAVDVSSGVESAPGVKDAQLIVSFVEAAKTAV